MIPVLLFIITGIFVGVWAIALLIWKYGKVEQRWHDEAHTAQLLRGENTDHISAGQELGPVLGNGFIIKE